MGTITDDIGVWNNLGTVQTTADWIKFPFAAVGGNATIRATFICADFSKIRSYAYLRARYQTQNTNQVSLSIRLYPSSDQKIIEFPIPQEFLDRSIFQRNFEIKKILKIRRKVGITPDIIWQIKLEELWG